MQAFHNDQDAIVSAESCEDYSSELPFAEDSGDIKHSPTKSTRKIIQTLREKLGRLLGQFLSSSALDDIVSGEKTEKRTKLVTGITDPMIGVNQNLNGESRFYDLANCSYTSLVTGDGNNADDYDAFNSGQNRQFSCTSPSMDFPITITNSFER
jgi:hypothetical protein